ncbi:MAG: hypothetical protein ABFS43_18210 [Thermodesulfobacteriota bacterium]
MFALIYDKHQSDRPFKKVISVYNSRENAEIALEERKKELGREVWECHTRIVWLEKQIDTGEVVGPGEYCTWGPDEKIPEGEIHSDSD